jgi:uncharacterized protein YecT (DUF1311 family)
MWTLVLTLAAAAPMAPECSGQTTLEVETCLAAALTKSDAELNRYYRAAVMHVTSEDGSKVAQGIVRAERSWLAYRDAECSTVYDRWSGGTIRGTMYFECRIRLTRLRTYSLWRSWLTYPDITPPVLPRPNVEMATTGRF